VHYLITRGFRALSRALSGSSSAPRPIYVSYLDGRAALTACTERGFAVAGMRVDREDPGDASDGTPPSAAVTLSVLGRIPLDPLTSELAELPGVLGVRVTADDEATD
jgi:putative Mg2+ transporter-C (MgtC) family protein